MATRSSLYTRVLANFSSLARSPLVVVIFIVVARPRSSFCPMISIHRRSDSLYCLYEQRSKAPPRQQTRFGDSQGTFARRYCYSKLANDKISTNKIPRGFPGLSRFNTSIEGTRSVFDATGANGRERAVKYRAPAMVIYCLVARLSLKCKCVGVSKAVPPVFFVDV